MFVGNLQIGFPSANDVFFTNSRLNFSSIPGAPVYQKPNFRVVPGYPGSINGSIFCSSKLKIGYINASPDGEVETYSTTSRLLEKEFKFSPTFDEYVKILESVRTGRRNVSERDVHGPKRKSFGASKAETVRQKGKSKDAMRNSPNSKADVIEKSGSAWAMVEGMLEEKAKKESGRERRVRSERIAGDMNGVMSARKVLHKQSDDGKLSIHGRTFEKKRMSQMMSEKPTEMSFRSTTLDKFESRNVVNNETRHGDSVKPRFTPYRAVMNLNDRNYGLHKKIHGPAEVIDDELLKNKRTRERGVKETKEYRKEFRSLNEAKSNNDTRIGKDHRENEKSNHSKRFYGGSSDGSMVMKSERPNFAKSVGKYESFSTFDSMSTAGKFRRSKMEDVDMEGNPHNQSINAQDSDLHTSGAEIYHEGGNRSNARFHDNIGAESISTRPLILTGRSSRTPVVYIKSLNDRNYGLHKKIHGAAEVIDDELSTNKMKRERVVKETKEYRREFRSLNEGKSNNHMRIEKDHRDNGKFNHSKRFYGGSSNGSMVMKSEGPNFAKSVRKYESSSTFDNMNTAGKLRSKMEDVYMEGNQHNQSINVQDSDLYIPGAEICHKRGNRNNARFHDTIGAESISSRPLALTGRSSRTPVDYHDGSEGGEIDGIALEDRAAFKTFEVFTDVRNRPRVLRMEMEERIRNLAKWLNASDLNMPEWQFSKMIHSAKIKFSEHSILRIVHILGSFGNWRQVLQVIEWFHSRERFKYYKSRYIYTTALDVLGKAKRPMEALNIFYAMRQELSSYPDLAAYHCIAVTLGQAGLMKELFDVIDCMRAAPVKKFDLGPLQKWDPRLNPDVVVYNAVLNACVHQKQWEGAFWVWQELKEHGIRPSSTTYGLIMEVMLECGKYNLVYEFFWKLQKNSIPGALNYKVLVNTLWREGKVEEAVQAVKDMETRGIVGCASLYYDLARCLCSSGRCEEALHQINKICKVAKKPLVVTYTGLIQACLNSGSIENAAYIFSQMKSVCSPNIITCNIMLKSYVEHGMFDEAKDLFEKLLSSSHENNRKDESNSKVFPDKFSFNTMMEACVATSKWDDFENFYREMLLHGYHFDERRHMRLVFDAWRAGKKNILVITWKHLTGNGRAPPPAIIKELFCMKMNEDEPAAAMSFIAVHQDMEIEAFSVKSWLNLLERGVRHISTQLLHELMRIIGESARPHPVHWNLLNACKELCSSIGGEGTPYCMPE